MRRAWVTVTLTFLFSLAVASAAQALVVADHGTNAGVALGH